MRILLVRLDGIGDAAACVPLVAALREAGHDVGVAVTTRNAGLFDPGAILAEHVLERIPWPAHGSTPESTRRAEAEIAAQRYDVALIASEEPEAYALAAAIPERVGFITGWARPLKTLWVRRRVTRAVSRAQTIGGEPQHEVEVLYRLGAGLVRETAPPRDAARLRALLAGETPVPERRGIVLQAGPKWAETGVMPETQRAIAASLSPHGLRVVAAPHDAGGVRARLGVEPETFADLRGWIAALDAAAAVVTVDTGAAHVAGMLGVPVVDVFPDRDFAHQVRRWRPWAAPSTTFTAAQAGGAPASVIEAALDAV
ncbi:MAG TPA: glycosyltransferase family 9 protein [Candidatus Elarobacter sp.]